MAVRAAMMPVMDAKLERRARTVLLPRVILFSCQIGLCFVFWTRAGSVKFLYWVGWHLRRLYSLLLCWFYLGEDCFADECQDRCGLRLVVAVEAVDADDEGEIEFLDVVHVGGIAIDGA